MSQSPALFRLFKMRLHQEPDVVLCRNRAKQVAEKFGFDRQDQIRIATAVSEIARNAFRYAKNASAEFLFETAAAPKAPSKRNPQSLVCVIQDEGPGIPHLEEVLAGRYKSATGMGTGILGAHRLMDRVEVVETGPSGTTVRLEKGLPRGKSISKTDLQPIVDAVAGPRQASPVEELSSQNHELLFMMEKVGEKSEELVRVNDELQETNRGVVALYDELDTIYRVGHVLASKLELDDLLQALIDATTEITGAEVGVFVYEDSDSDPPVRQHTAGLLAVEFRGDDALVIHRVMHECPPGQAMVRFDDLEQESGVRLAPKGIVLRSYLAVPVVMTSGTQSGAMVFAHRSPGVFSERSERILASVALQAAIGIENARLYKSVRSASAAKDEFLAILSHELRNPLNPIFARLSMLEEHPGMPREALEDIRLIRRNLELETRLIDDLLDMTRISRGKVIIGREPVDLHEIIEAACHACSSYAVEERIRLELKLEAGRRTVRGDSVRLQQVFWNLINNAVKFSSSGGMVVVRTWNEQENGQDVIRATVSDSGSGIAPNRTEIIFQPFEQAEVNSGGNSFGGLGLGLAICRSIVTAHEGEVTARSDGPNQGAVFTVTLHLISDPVNPETSADDEVGKPVPKPQGKSPSPVQAPVVTPLKPAAQGGYHILLVDDHQDTRSSFKSLLERRGHRVVMAGNVADACREAGQTRFQLLISDIGLPDASGYDLMRTLSKDPELKGIAVSGYGMKEDIARSRQAGFSVHLTKPLRITDLEKAIAEVMGPDIPGA